MAATATKEKERLSLEVNPTVKDLLKDLERRSHATSLTEVIRRSLSLLDLVLEHQESGGTLIFRHPDGTDEKLRIL
jgi:hypothetical protein